MFATSQLKKFAPLGILLLVACASQPTASEPSPTPILQQAPPAPALEITPDVSVNELCPLEGGVVVEDCNSKFGGPVIGFCSEQCRTEWEHLSSEKRTALLVETMKGCGRSWTPKQ